MTDVTSSSLSKGFVDEKSLKPIDADIKHKDIEIYVAELKNLSNLRNTVHELKNWEKIKRFKEALDKLNQKIALFEEEGILDFVRRQTSNVQAIKHLEERFKKDTQEIDTCMRHSDEYQFTTEYGDQRTKIANANQELEKLYQARSDIEKEEKDKTDILAEYAKQLVCARDIWGDNVPSLEDIKSALAECTKQVYEKEKIYLSAFHHLERFVRLSNKTADDIKTNHSNRRKCNFIPVKDFDFSKRRSSISIFKVLEYCIRQYNEYIFWCYQQKNYSLKFDHQYGHQCTYHFGDKHCNCQHNELTLNQILEMPKYNEHNNNVTDHSKWIRYAKEILDDLDEWIIQERVACTFWEVGKNRRRIRNKENNNFIGRYIIGEDDTHDPDSDNILHCYSSDYQCQCDQCDRHIDDVNPCDNVGDSENDEHVSEND